LFRTLKVLNYRLSKSDDKRMKDKGNDKAITLQIMQTFLFEILMLSCVSYKGERNAANTSNCFNDNLIWSIK
jgi:hypothetical protein